MRCREAFILIAVHEQDGDLSQFLQTEAGIQVEAHSSGCRCGLCERSVKRIRSAGVGATLRVIEGKKAASG